MARSAITLDPVLGPLSCDRLTADYRVFQRRHGHRFSVDDVATACVAWTAVPKPARVLDLGCGLGSVLLHLAWKCPQARLWGVEAQAMSFDLVTRNVALNQVGDRVTLHHGDLRDSTVLGRLEGPFDLVTGTPPYFPPSTAVDALDEQRAFARVEYRGGVEAYVAAASQVLAPSGTMAMAGASEAHGRVLAAAAQHQMHVVARHVVVPRAGVAPLFTVWTLQRQGRPMVEVEWVIRDSQGRRTPDAHMLTRFSGLEPGND